MLNLSTFPFLALVTALPTTTSTLMNQIEQQQDLLPNFTLGLKNMSVPITRDVTFTCHVRNIGQFRVGWVKADTKAIQAIGNQMITHNPRISVSGDFESTFNLHIKQVSTEDSGNYMCQVNTDPMIYQSAWLSVMIPPDIDMKLTSGDITAREHEDTAQLSCQADGVPRPRIVWRREGGGKIRVRTSHHQHRQVELWTGDTLEIHRVRREDMGAYLCIASNDVPPTVSKRIYLHVQFAPTILPGLSVLGSAPGKPLTLECIVESYPEAFVVWTFGGKIIHDKEEGYSLVKLAHSMYRLSSKLTLTNYNENKKGIYTCRATNSLGQTETSTRVYTAAEELIPRREPKYEIIVEKEDKVTVIEDVNVPTVDREHVENPLKEPESKMKKRKKVGKQKSENRKQRQRIGLLGTGTAPAAGSEILMYWTVFNILTQLFFI